MPYPLPNFYPKCCSYAVLFSVDDIRSNSEIDAFYVLNDFIKSLYK